jgi:predicted histidine transporter YuiF (NhaC family)
MGDTVPLIVRSGRLNVNTTVRVVGIAYTIGDDGDENVEVTIGRPTMKLSHLLTKTQREVDALARR